MAKKLKKLTFDEAIENAKAGKPVFAFDLSQDNRITVKQFKRLEIYEAVCKDRAFYVVEESAE